MNLSARPLFILETANNRMGSVEHGLRIIRGVNAAASALANTNLAAAISRH